MKKISLLLLVLISTISISCRKALSEAGEQIIGESFEKGAKVVSKKTAIETASEISEQAVKHIEWDDLLKIYTKKGDEGLVKILKKLDNNIQDNIIKAIKNEPQILHTLSHYPNLIPNFSKATQNLSKFGSDPNLFNLFAKAEMNGKGVNFLNKIELKEVNGSLKFISENKIIGSYKDGVFDLGKVLDSKNPLTEVLIPNTLYTTKGINYSKINYFTNEFGVINKIKAERIEANELVDYIFKNTKNIDLGPDFKKQIATLKESSKGNDIDLLINIKHSKDGNVVQSVFIEANTANKPAIIKRTFTNKNSDKLFYTTKNNHELLEKFSSSLKGLSEKKRTNLLVEMEANPKLAADIHSNPQNNIQKWLDTRNSVNKQSIQVLPNNRLPINSTTYAGNTYSFNPLYNPKLMDRLKRGNGYVDLRGFGKLSYNDLIGLDKLYPKGVPFSKKGFPNFSSLAYKDLNGKSVIVKLPKLTGDRAKDIAIADKEYLLKFGTTKPKGYTWHHIENSNDLILIETKGHQLIDHSGGVSTLAQ